jgi:hypothetical protein
MRIGNKKRTRGKSKGKSKKANVRNLKSQISYPHREGESTNYEVRMTKYEGRSQKAEC